MLVKEQPGRGQWPSKVKEAIEKINRSSKVSEKTCKDTQKKRREERLVTTVSSLVCDSIL